MSDPEMNASSDNANTSQDTDYIVLDPTEVRVLSVMAEKEALTPDNYPISLNALTNGCNQLSSRDPIMNLSEQEVQDALDRLIQRRLVSEVRQAGARVAKYEHRMRIQWTLEQDKLSALVILMLRGPQTAAEIRTRSGRLHEFPGIADVEEVLQFLIDKYPPLVSKLPRAAGTKETRYAHTFFGEIFQEPQRDFASGAAHGGSHQDRIARLESEMESLRSELDQLKAELTAFRKQFD
jgi:uncharacterized protein